MNFFVLLGSYHSVMKKDFQFIENRSCLTRRNYESSIYDDFILLM